MRLLIVGIILCREMQELPYDLTIVTVCRNALSLLPRCISSVQPVYQSALRVEHLLVDGASTDGSASYLWCQQQAGRITRYISEPDAGLYHAMNKAINMARGKVVVFINADDEFCSGIAEMCCAPILRGEAAYVVASALCVNGRKTRVMRPRIQMTLWRQPYCHQSMFCSRVLLQKMGGFDAERFPIGADTDLMRRLYVAKIPCVEIPVIAARFHMGGVSSTPATYRDVYELLLKFEDACCSEIRKYPSVACEVVKYMRRYANKKIMLENMPVLQGGDVHRLVHFVRGIGDSLPPQRRMFLKMQVYLQRVWYFVLSMCSSGRKSQSADLNNKICGLITQNL